jgi:HPt (histidine-containing phosphotransfer) domain-containing protein
MADLNEDYSSAKRRINALKTFKEVSAAAKQLKSSAGNSLSQGVSQTASSLDKIAQEQKRFLRNQPTSFEELLNLIGLTNGNGLETTKYLKKRLLETVVKIEPQMQKIISEEALNVLGCSQEQTFKGFSASDLRLNPISTRLPITDGIYVPVQSLDILSILKSPINSKLSKISLEYVNPNTTIQDNLKTYRPYEGEKPFPMNREMALRLETNNVGKSYYQEYDVDYQGISNQKLFDFVYSPTNQYGVNQDSYRIALIDKPVNVLTNSGVTVGATSNKVGEFLKDYYSTIKIIDSVDFITALVNIVCGAVDMTAKPSSDEITESTKFELILQRILGLCFDSRSEIDVSGVSKIAELDGVNDSFYELTEVDLRNIENRISNIQNGVTEYEDCGNVKLPVDYETITDELLKFRDTVDVLNTEQQVSAMSEILDTIYQNPEWKVILPFGNYNYAFNKEFLKQIPLAVASVVLSPKVLLPIFTLLQVVESDATNAYNRAVTSANTYVQSGNTILGGVNNIVNNSTDFLKVFQSFNIQVVSKIGVIFIEELYNVLKKDLLNLLSSIIKDVEISKRLKKYKMILRLSNILLIISSIRLIRDYRKCKSLINDILTLLNTIFGRPGGKIPLPLLLLSQFLPGSSPERATIATIELLQSVGIPTGPLPDGTPNLMTIYNLMTNKGIDDEETENGKVEGVVVTPAGILSVFGKKR